jgi:hydroxyacylglutathione hydrolase
MADFEIVQLPARSDNFAVLVHDPASGATASIDAPDAAPIKAELAARGWTLTHILVTHKHMDHVEGIEPLRQAYNLTVIGPQKSAAETGQYDQTVADGDHLDFAGAEIRVIETPGHTLDHVSYYLPDQKLAFVADTLFALGCGRVFEGTPEMMWESLKKLRALPDETVVYCGHEYTLANAEFALSVEPENAALAARAAEIRALRADGKPTLPTTIGRERQTNPFLRADDPVLAGTLGMAGADPVAVFAEVRGRKDRF